ncbi:hypothetical protein PFISCL1PPCAC_18742, partial [Pristionchus fissidentatus]
DHFKILNETTAQSKRGCEVLCDKSSECTGFSFISSGLQSPCSLLGSANESEVCSIPVAIYNKQTTGCPACFDIAAEMGEDPCVD